MQTAINLTPVCITLIICVTIYALCKLSVSKKDEGKESKSQRELKSPKYIHQYRSGQEQRLAEYTKGQVKKGEAEK